MPMTWTRTVRSTRTNCRRRSRWRRRVTGAARTSSSEPTREGTRELAVVGRGEQEVEREGEDHRREAGPPEPLVDSQDGDEQDEGEDRRENDDANGRHREDDRRG